MRFAKIYTIIMDSEELHTSPVHEYPFALRSTNGLEQIGILQTSISLIYTTVVLTAQRDVDRSHYLALEGLYLSLSFGNLSSIDELELIQLSLRLLIMLHLAGTHVTHPHPHSKPKPKSKPSKSSHAHGSSSSKAKGALVSQATINSKLLQPALFSRVAYCSPKSVLGLKCGAPCDVLKGMGMKVRRTLGDGGAIPHLVIATDLKTKTIFVAHQGTNPKSLHSIVNDIKIKQVSMNKARFPKAPGGALVHDGFQSTQGKTSKVVLAEVVNLIHGGFQRVVVTGHSLGAAIALLDAVMLRMNLPSSVHVDSVVFGLPRVGNQAFANMVDSILPGFTRVSNQNDPVTVIPLIAMKYRHPSGEFHISSVGKDGKTAVMHACTGQEDKSCEDGFKALKLSVSDHIGPYFDGISFGYGACPA
ncbi:hypothetical protein ABKN59_010746 [Abortiporus biennis]